MRLLHACSLRPEEWRPEASPQMGRGSMGIVRAAPLSLSVSSLFELTQSCGLTSLLVVRWVESAPVLSCLQIMHLCFQVPLSKVCGLRVGILLQLFIV